MPVQLCPARTMARSFLLIGAVFVAATAFATATASAADPMDWPNWRGPEQNRISRETGLIDKWDPETGENVLWKNTEAAGICSPIVMNGKVYSQVRYKPDTKEEQEEVICLDAETGKKLWENRWNVYLSDVPAERIGWSSVVGDPETGRIYALGVNGYFSCIDGETGKTIWSRSLGEEFGLISPYGGRTHPPAIFEDLVIINGVMVGWGDTAPPAHRILALDKNTGEPRWFAHTKPLPEDTIFSTPFFTVLDGQAAMVIGSSDGAVWAFQPRTGKADLEFPHVAARTESFAGGGGRQSLRVAGRGNLGPQNGRFADLFQGHWKGRHHQNERSLDRAQGNGGQIVAAGGRRPSVQRRRFGQLVDRRCRNRQTDRRQAGEADRHDRARQPAICRRQNLSVFDDRLARDGTDRKRREIPRQNAVAGKGRSERLAGRVARQNLLADRFGIVLPRQER